MDYAFAYMHHFSLDLTNWKVHNVQHAQALFAETHHFHGNFSGWQWNSLGGFQNGIYNHSHQAVGWMYKTRNFHGDVSNWNVYNVISMAQLFQESQNARPNMIGWNVQTLIDTRYMFAGSIDFYDYDNGMSTWKPNHVGYVSSMYEASYNCSTPGVALWDTSYVVDMSGVMANSKYVNADISQWTTPNVQSLKNAFMGAIDIELDLRNWDVRNVLSLDSFFTNSKRSKLDVTGWDTSSVQSMENLVSKSIDSELRGIEGWDVQSVTNMRRLMMGTQFSSDVNIDLSQWNTEVRGACCFLPSFVFILAVYLYQWPSDCIRIYTTFHSSFFP